ncbi:uncharacterized protein LOC143271745 [Peromyscus maniculatus bairdii]|uniref:uncharacterized protein LOC143271745 n=1 Tax=Peromyscus maniculatus bairdii TaxID=230844 RepID=UPI003FD5E4B9
MAARRLTDFARGVDGPEAGARGPARPGWGRSRRSTAEKGWGAGHGAYLLHAALVLLRHGQQHAVEALLLLLPAHRAALRAPHSRSAMPALRTVRVGPNGSPRRPSAAEPETRTAPAARARPSLLSSRLPAHRCPLSSRNTARFTGTVYRRQDELELLVHLPSSPSTEMACVYHLKSPPPAWIPEMIPGLKLPTVRGT